MFLDIDLCREEDLLISILFKRNKLDKTNFIDINYEKIVKISSNHLVLPTLYINLKRKKLLKYVPNELKEYIKEIYEINKSRNIVLIKELKEVSNYLSLNNINHVFLKGAAIISGNYIEDIGERMIGDIDLLVDYQHKNLAINLLNKKNYKSEYIYKIWDANSYPNFINKNRIFAIDLHNRLLPKKYDYLINSDDVIKKSKKNLSDIKVLNPSDEIKFLIYNYQICDYGYLRGSYNYRKMYDIFLMKKKFNFNKYNNDKFIESFFKVASILKIMSNVKYRKTDIYETRFKLKIKNKYYHYIDNLVCNALIFSEYLPVKFLEFIYNKKYRKHSIKKVLS